MELGAGDHLSLPAHPRQRALPTSTGALCLGVRITDRAAAEGCWHRIAAAADGGRVCQPTIDEWLLTASLYRVRVAR
jgi:hypothetical protein